MKKKLYILDVSSYIFRAYFALPPMTNSQGGATHALFGFIRSVIKLFKDFSPEHLVAVYDGPDNKKQRSEIYEKYKSNRIRRYEDLPEQIEKSKEFCDLLGIEHIELPGVEADDTIGSVALYAHELGAEVYICTSDKDLAQLVREGIFILNTWKNNLLLDSCKVEEIYGVPPKNIVDLLALMGDSSDNIPGVKGIGPKGAQALLKEFGSLDELYANLDRVSGKKKELLACDEEAARMSKRLATIYTDLSFEKNETLFGLKETDLFGLKEFYIEMGFNTLVQELEEELRKQVPEEIVDYRLVDSPESLKVMLDELFQHSEIALDVQASHFKPMQSEIVGIGFSVKERQAFYVPFNGKLGKEAARLALQPLFEDRNIQWYGHNIKFALHLLENTSFFLPKVSFDTMLASYLLNSGGRQHSLDVLALQYFGKVKTSLKSLIGSGKKEISLEDAPIDKVCHYCSETVDFIFRLKKRLEDQMDKRKLQKLIYEIELPLTLVLLKMERAGMCLNADALVKISEEVKRELAASQEEIFVLAGETFNLSSPKQLSAILFDKLAIPSLKKTATGLSTRAEVLESLATEHPIAEKILYFRSLDKLRSTYLEALPNEINPKTGRIHPNFNQFVTATGRLACQDPNLQNIPVRSQLGKKIREAFVPQKKSWSYLSADYSQVELRLLAHLSEEPELIRAFLAGEDIHAYTASLMFETPLEEVSSKQRFQAKAINFGIIYGQQAFGLAQTLGIEIKQASKFIAAYFERYPKIQSFIAMCIKKAQENQKAITMTGRERDLKEILSSNAIVRNAAERLAINTPLQGSAADLIKLAMLKIDRSLTDHSLKSFLVLQVHDELIFEAPDEELAIMAPLVREAMEKVFMLKVPLIVDMKVGKNWAEC